ncbi:MAG: family N-acetyltransferase [Microbacteriaceae bacterium]|nr:family N-acetyltransferase [Microbacteriaceae bacterium]
MAAFEVEELRIPLSIDDADAADFIVAVEVRNAVEAEGYGTTELGLTAAEALPYALDFEFAPNRFFGVRVDGELVARGYYEWSVGDGDRVAWTVVDVLPEFRHRGIGRAMADHMERIAVDDDRQRLLVYVVSPEGPGARIDAASGFGSVPAGNREVRFLTARGFTLEQVERGSRLALPLEADELRGRVEAARERSGAEYAVHTWTGVTPERWLDDMATLCTRMSTDAPTAGLAEPEDVWTAERIRSDDERHMASPRALLTAAIEHVPTGRLVGFTILSVPPEADRAVIQEDTLVLREHRGHALGMLLKVANLERLQNEMPGHPSVTTFNAEENRHMLRVNEAVGFVPIGYEGAWRKVLDAP